MSIPLVVSSCMNMMDSGGDRFVYPMYIDDNGNGKNDYVEKETHYPGDDKPALAKRSSLVKTFSNGHDFIDENQDGICDFAQDGGNIWHGPGFVDNNIDGICDYWESGNAMHNHNRGMRFIDENGNSINDYVERTTHKGGAHNFIDENSDGICDFAQNGGKSWHGPGYVDTDHDGICDYWQPGHMGYGGMHHR